jgi:hypothetical protein
MKRVELWEALSRAADAVETASDVWQREPSLQNRVMVDVSARQFVECLSPVIGTQAACRYEACLRALHDSIARHASLHATMQGRTLDAGDMKLLNQLELEEMVASWSYTAAKTALMADISAAHTRDEEKDI